TLHFYDSLPIEGNDPGLQGDVFAIRPGISKCRYATAAFNSLEKSALRAHTDLCSCVVHPLCNGRLLCKVQLFVAFDRYRTLADCGDKVTCTDLFDNVFFIPGA